MDPIVSVQNKNFTGNTEKLAKVLGGPIGSLKSFTLTIPWNLAKAVKIFPGIIARRHHTDQKTMGLLKRAVRRVKEGTSAVLLQSGLNENWWADSMECCTYLRKRHRSLVWWEDPIRETFLGNHSKDRSFHLGSLVEYYPKTAKDQSRIHQFGKKVLPGLFLGCALYAGGNLERWRTDCRPWGVGDDGRIGNLLEKTQCERGDISPKRRIYFSNRRWTNQPPWWRSRPKNTHLGTAAISSRRRWRFFFPGEPEGSSSTTSWLISGCRWSDEWFLVHVRKLHVSAITLNQESNFTRREEESFPVPLKYIGRIQNYSYEFGCQARATHRWLLEYRWVKRYVWFLDRFHSVYSTRWKSSWRIFVVRVEINEKNSWHPGQIIYGQKLWKSMEKNAQLKERQKWFTWKAKTR